METEGDVLFNVINMINNYTAFRNYELFILVRKMNLLMRSMK